MNNKTKCFYIMIIICLLLLLIYNKSNTISTFKVSSQNEKKYYIIKENFLNINFINEIYTTIISENKWIYTTNIGNEKIKHNKDIINRKIKAKEMYNKGLFSYSKYEYDNNANIINKIKQYLLEKKTLDIITKLTGEKITQIMDIFISKYEKGDFLSKHTDNTLGKYAFMIYLNKSWNVSCGGNLNIIKNDKNIDTIIPEHNKLILMNVYDELRPHYIDEVICKQDRYAITGWFT
jgi:SM-20-related protein